MRWKDLFRGCNKPRKRVVSAPNGQIPVLSMVGLDVQPLAKLYNHERTVARQLNVGRAATFAARTHTNNVIIRNTHSGDLSLPISRNAPSNIGRSHSLTSQHHLPILAPCRLQRINLEIAISDIWTRHLFPFPGMKLPRTDTSFRASATSLIRKLSMASITSNFSWRSSATASNQSQMFGKDAVEIVGGHNENHSKQKNVPREDLLHHLPVVPVQQGTEATALVIDFHHNPDKFLPPDFELPSSKHGRSTNCKVNNSVQQDVKSSDTPRSHQTRPGHEVRTSSGQQPDIFTPLPVTSALDSTPGPKIQSLGDQCNYNAQIKAGGAADASLHTKPLKKRLRRLVF